MHVLSALEHPEVGIEVVTQGDAHAGSGDCAWEPGIY